MIHAILFAALLQTAPAAAPAPPRPTVWSQSLKNNSDSTILHIN